MDVKILRASEDNISQIIDLEIGMRDVQAVE